jgi:hypothetical protein
LRLTASLRSRLEQIRYRRGLQDLDAIGREAPRLSHLPQPAFIIIGPKCGTSWPRGALDQHPDILVVPDEIKYFSDFLDRPVECISTISPSGSPRPLRAQPRVLGEKSARYCAISPKRIRLIQRLLPDVRLILMTRDPVARHWPMQSVISRRSTQLNALLSEGFVTQICGGPARGAKVP